MKLKLSQIKERYPDIEILNYDPEVVITQFNHDSRVKSEGELFIPIIGESFDGHDYIKDALKQGSVATICQSDRLDKIEGLEVPIIVVDDIHVGLAEVLAIIRDEIAAPVIGITGSTGKSTTRSMLKSVLEQAGSVLMSEKSNTLWGNARLLADYNGEDFVVLEMGMDMLREIERHSNGVKPDIGSILNIGVVHASKVGVEGVFNTKKELADYCVANGKPIVLNVDDPKLAVLSKEIPGDLLRSVGSKGGTVKYISASLSDKGTNFTFEINSEVFAVVVKLYGEEFAVNVGTTVAITLELGLSLEEIKKGLESFEGIPQRFEITSIKPNVLVVNDAYNANPTSMKASLKAFSQMFNDLNKTIILGEMRELGEVSENEHLLLNELIGGLGIKSYYVGAHSEKMSNCEVVSLDEAKAVYDGLISGTDDVAVLLKASNGIGLWKFVE